MEMELELKNPSVHIHNGPYKGDISALCILKAPRNRPFPLLLAGTGPQLLVFDMGSYQLLLSSCVFEGVRMHGIAVCSFDLGSWEHVEGSGVFTVIAVHGERTVKLFKLMLQEKLLEDKQTVEYAKLIPYQKLPRFSHWVLDVQFLKDKCMIGVNGANLIAIGLSNNAVYLWSISSCAFIYHVQCTEKCLLYSLRFWGQNPGNLLVAAGTIFNEILVWSLDIQLSGAPFRNGNSIFKEGSFEEIDKTVAPKKRLKGHEGSIFRIAWSQDGRQLASVSDDRSMRVWSIREEPILLAERSMEEHHDGRLFAVYGHAGRIWDCHIDPKFFISVSEDCTFRVWSLDGQPLAKVSAHIGRGIWRCVYDSDNDYFITAGADSSIKVHLLSKWLSGPDISEGDKTVMGQTPKLEVFSIDLEEEDSFRRNGRLDSKTEYVRCLSLVDPTCLVIATNQGLLKYLYISKEGQLSWSEIYGNQDLEPIFCLDVLRHNGKLWGDEHHGCSEDWIVIGDSKGFVTVISGKWNNGHFDKTYLCKWSAEGERKLLGVYWSQSLGPSHVFTANSCGTICMWNLGHHSNQLNQNQNACLSNELCNPAKNHSKSTSEFPPVIRFQSCFNVRIVCLDTQPEEEILICGDQRGNIIVFSVPSFSTPVGLTGSLQHSFSSFKGAHGISTVASIHVVGKRNQHQMKICSTGRDGCMCTFAVDKSDGSIICLRVEKVPTVTVLESYTIAPGLIKNALRRTIVSGFTAVDFLICDLYSDFEIVRIPCGGWRRPHSYLIGDFPEVQYCVAFVKDGVIYIHRKWCSEITAPSSTSFLPRTSNLFFSSLLLQSQFHGREVHAVNIISSRSESRNKTGIHPVSWIITGAEDGAVRIMRFHTDVSGQFDVSQVLGEHVGGSAVRAVTSITSYSVHNRNALLTEAEANSIMQQPICLIISVGAKEVLTSWLLEWESDMDESGQTRQMLSSRWLNTKRNPRKGKLLRGLQTHSNDQLENERIDLDEDDHRYMAVTAFSVFFAQRRCQTCFAVTASSNATLSLHAFDLLEGNWVEIAILHYHKAPVLSLQHLVIPECNLGHSSSNMYIVFSGATDGSIVLWNLTNIVSEFCCKELSKGNKKVYRPPSGRGSQGGRQRWKRSNVKAEEDKKERSEGEAEVSVTVETLKNDIASIDLNVDRGSGALSSNGTVHVEEDLPYLYTLTPEFVLSNVHQSGVNSLSVSTLKSETGDMRVAVVSGGDDQALHVATFVIDKSTNVPLLNCCSKGLMVSAHSSAVKGVWTDGSLVFSTGLDQRLRCWNLEISEQHCSLVELAHSVINVPEPAALHVEFFNRRNYRIAVVGRGLQVFEVRGG